MTTIRPEVLAFIDSAQALSVRAASNRPPTIDEVWQMASCVFHVQARLQGDEHPRDLPLTSFHALLLDLTPIRTTLIDLRPEDGAFCNATKDLLLSLQISRSPWTEEERQKLRICIESLAELVSRSGTTALVRQSILPTGQHVTNRVAALDARPLEAPPEY